MNALLLEKINTISADKVTELKDVFRQSPLMLRFVEFLGKQQKENFSTAEAVCYVYEIKKNDSDYAVYENRFYKLRKKLNESFREQESVQTDKIPGEQQQMNEARMLSDNGKFKEAQLLLEKTEKQCWQNNVFEILPDAVDRLIQMNQVLNTIEKNKSLHKKYSRAITLYADLMDAKNIVRQIYEVNLEKGIGATDSLYNRLAKLVVKHRTYPRFKLLYNFTAAYYKTAARDQDYIQKTHVINRHITAAKQIMRDYPDIPAIYYTQGFQANQYYRLIEIQAFSYFNALRFREAAEVMLELYDKVTEKKSKFINMKNEVFFTNAIHILAYGGQLDEALRAVEDYRLFVTENRLHEKLTNVYCEAANVHSLMYPAKSRYDADFLIKQVDKYIAQQPKERLHLGHGQLLKIRLLFSEHRFDDLAKYLKAMNIQPFFTEKNIGKLVEAVIQARLGNLSEIQIIALKNEIKKIKLSVFVPGDYNWLIFLEKLMKHE